MTYTMNYDVGFGIFTGTFEQICEKLDDNFLGIKFSDQMVERDGCIYDAHGQIVATANAVYNNPKHSAYN